MSYEIKDRYHTLTITITTDIADYGNLYLNVFKSTNLSTTSDMTCVATNQRILDNGKYVYDFIIRNNQKTGQSYTFNIGDVLDRFECIHTGSNNQIDVWKTYEGVTVLLDGEYYKTIKSNDIMADPVTGDSYGYVKLKFTEPKDYSLQCVYQGNEQSKIAYTTQEHFIVDSPAHASPTPKITGKYALVFYNPKILSNLSYKDNKNIYFKLTRGGQPVGGKTIEIVAPNGAVKTSVTDSRGIVKITNNRYNAGKFQLGAYFIQDGKIQCKTYKTILIRKADPKITFNHTPLKDSDGTYQKKERVYITLRDNFNKPIKKTKISVYHNNQLKSIKTNDKGYASIDCGVGRHNFKVVYNGTTNLNKKEEKYSIFVARSI